MTKLICTLAFAVAILSAAAQTTYYSRNGATAPRNWNEADSWTLNADGSGAAAAVPGRDDNVVILATHDIIINATNDNGSAGVSANGLSRGNVGTFNDSGTANFYQIGNITINTGATLTSNVRMMVEGSTYVLGTFTSTGDVINLGRMEITANASFTFNDDFILSGFSETLLFATINMDDDIYIDHTDALLCGDGTVNIGVNSPNTPDIQYFNSADISQICSTITVSCGPGPGCSGFPQSGTGSFTLAQEQKLIAAGSVWKYLDDGSNQGTAWHGTSFDDSSWASGLSELGYGDGDEVTVVSFGADPNDKHETTYFRKTFYVEDPSIFNDVLLRLVRDDGAVVYINDVEVDRQNMPGGAITFTTFASSAIGGADESTFFETTLASTDLVAGTNTIAVEIHQANLTSSDISFNLELIGRFATDLVAAGSNWRYLDDGTDQGTAWQAIAFDDSGWATGNAQLGYGDGDETTVVSFGGDPNNKYITTYFRQSFSVTDPNDYVGLTLHLLRDDGAVVYINGTEVHRDNMPGGAITYTTQASSAVGGADEDTFFQTALSTSTLVAGTNVIAVEIHQANITSSDLSFDLRLEGIENNPLPVELVYFDAHVEKDVSVLEWTTASELNNDYFEVERSDETLVFLPIITKKGMGTSFSPTSYQVYDRYPLAGVNYYRLRQVDLDGGFSYSSIVSLFHDKVVEVVVYPNPAKDEIRVKAEGSTGVKVFLKNIYGSIIKVDQRKVGNELVLEIAGLPSGIYLLDIQSAGQTYRLERVAVQK